MNPEETTLRTLGAIILAVSLLLPAVAGAQEGQPVTGKCEAGKCDEFQVLTREVVGVGPRGRLVKSRLRAWTTQDGRRADLGEEDGYAFCSRYVPALIGRTDKGAVANLLAPLTAAEYERTPNAYATYFEICHGAGRAAMRGRDRLAEELGYVAVRQTASKVQMTRPEDALSLDDGPRREDPRPRERPYGYGADPDAPVPPADIPEPGRRRWEGRGASDGAYGRQGDVEGEDDGEPLYRGPLRGWRGR